MIPVDMQILHDPENGQYGDCQRACIASLLNINTDDVPHFHEGTDDEKIFDSRLNEFLCSKGLFHLETTFFDLSKKPDCYHMIYGKTERDTWHAVIGFNGEVIHDPHPSKAGLLDDEKEDWIFAFLVNSSINL